MMSDFIPDASLHGELLKVLDIKPLVSIFARLLNWNLTVLTNKSWDFHWVTKYHNHIAAVIDLLLAVLSLDAIVTGKQVV